MNQQILDMQAELTEIRRQLHQIPEIGLAEQKTANFIENKLKEFGITELTRCLETGIIARIAGQGKAETIAFRADMDGLPVQETEKPYASCHTGMMHACGHDGHMTMLLGFAKYLMQQAEQPLGDVILIFQPAEEGPGGAELMIQTGFLETYQIKKVIGCHIFPQFPEGTVACRPGAMMARNGEVTITVHGKSAHGAQPHLGTDAILATGAIISALHTILARNVSPLESGVLTFGTVSGGEAKNIIAKEVVLGGTMRAFSDEVYHTLTERVQTVATSIAEGFGCTAEVDFFHMYRVVKNDAQMVAQLAEICGEHYLQCEPYMLAEDFSFFQQELPGIFFFLGSGNEEKGLTHPLHHASFDFDERILPIGIDTYAKLLQTLQA